MTKQILKVMAAGILAGIALFLMPFILLHILAIFLIMRLIFRLLRGSRNARRLEVWRTHIYPAFSRRWHRQSEEGNKTFREKMENDFFNKI